MLVGAWDILDREVDGHTVKFGTVEYDRAFLQQLDDATRLLASPGREGRRAHDAVLLETRAGGSGRSTGPSTTRGASTASTRSTATSSRRTRVGTRWSTSTGSCHPAGQVRRLDQRRPGARRRCALHPRRCDHRRPVAGAPAERGRSRASRPTPPSSTGPTRGGSGRSSGGSAPRPARHREQPGRRRRDLVGDEEVRLRRARSRCRCATSRAPCRRPAARARSPTRTSCAAPCAGGRGDRAAAASRRWPGAARSRRGARAMPSRPCTVTSWKNSSSSDSSSGPSNNETWNGFSKSAGRFGVITSTVPSSVVTRASSATCCSGRDEVLDDVRRADPVDRARPGRRCGRRPSPRSAGPGGPTRARRRSRSAGCSRRR